MTYAAVVDTSTVIALARGGVFVHLGQVFQPLLIGSDADQECQGDPHAHAALNQTQNQTPAFPTVVKLLARRRAYDPNLSPADIEGIEVALARSAILITQDDLQRVEAISAGVKMVADTFEVLEVFKRLGLMAQVRPVLEQMEQNGERYSRSERNKLLRRVNEPLIP